MKTWSFIIIGISFIAILIAWRIKNKNKELKREAVRNTAYIWAVQGPFCNGRDSAIAFARSIYVLNGEEKLESSEACIIEHAKIYNQDPEEWEKIRKKSIVNYKGSYTNTMRTKVEEVEKLCTLKDNNHLPPSLVVIQLNLGSNGKLLHEWISEKEDKRDKTERAQAANGEKLSSTDWMNLPWSEKPGAYEKHLKVRLESPYFNTINQAVSESDLKAMQDLDNSRHLQCFKKMESFTEEEVKPLLMGDGPSFREALYIKEELEAIIKKAMAVDGEAINIAKQAFEQREICISYLKNTFKDSPEAMHAIDRAEMATHENNKFFTPFISQVLDEEGPIQNDELVPALLSQEPSTIAITMNIIKDDNREAIEREAKEILDSAKENGYIDPQYEQKIEALKGEWPKNLGF